MNSQGDVFNENALKMIHNCKAMDAFPFTVEVLDRMILVRPRGPYAVKSCSQL
jgi:hypothetical protein